ncbi:MAG TPA: SoxR reducing system RseC family protein [Spirochaetota bacterium]|nr:SoxR reducing system RseC family protein [Spirochaetota bacterium]HPI89025.1 SoxR reducing system RseC family protein [Spirochaetota bacterium]HPR49267.1 SoxR reducing system RseC family protein [Spirochaetota bacterium]
MDGEKGIVIETSSRRILVESDASDMCSSCEARHACMAGEHRKRKIWIENTLGAGLGDTVSFVIKEKSVIVSSILLYLFPVLALIGGALAGSNYNSLLGLDRDASAAVGGIIALAAAVVIVWIVSKIISRRSFFAPVLIGIESLK